MQPTSTSSLFRSAGWWTGLTGRRIRLNLAAYLAAGAAGTAVGAVVDRVGDVPWWAFTAAGVVSAWGCSWLTALDDVRHPLRSLRIVGAELRGPEAAVHARVLAYDVPMYAPPTQWGGARRVGGTSLAFDGVFAPVEVSVTVTWVGDDARVQVSNATGAADRTAPGELPWGIAVHVDDLVDAGELPRDVFDGLESSLRVVELRIANRERTAIMLDLPDDRLGWVAEVDVGPGQRLDIAARGVTPEELTLVPVSLDDLVPPSR